MNEILKVESLNAFYGRSQITFDIDLFVNPGEVAVVVGRNGVGKTTTTAHAGVAAATDAVRSNSTAAALS